MKKINKIILILGAVFIGGCFCFPFNVHGQALIIDHRHTDISQIPDYWLERAKELTFHYAHTSHGHQIINGLDYLETVDFVKYSYAWRRDETAGLPPVESPAALRIYDGNPPEIYIGSDDYWDGESAMNRTRVVVNTGDYNYSMWSWCRQQHNNSMETVQRYLDNMNQFESEYPNMRFIYITGTSAGDGAATTLVRNNDMVRDYVTANNKILFDFNDIERYDPDGNYYADSTDTCTWCPTWCSNHPEDCANLPSCAHAHDLQCILKGKAFWWMMARLAGWDGTDSSPDTTPPSKPTHFQVDVISFSQIDLSWNISVDNIGVSGYKIYRNGHLVATITENLYSDTDISSSSIYSYRVSAYDTSSNESVQTSAISVTAPDVIPPTIINRRAIDIKHSSVAIAWNTDEPSTTQVLYGLNADCDQQTVEDRSSKTSHLVMLRNLQPSTIYHYRVISKDSSGNESISKRSIFNTIEDPACDEDCVLAQEQEEEQVQEQEQEQEQQQTTYQYQEGSLIRARGDFKVYIIKGNYKRHIFNPAIFNMYRHFSWDSIIEVEKDAVDSYVTSDLYRAAGDYRVYSLEEVDEVNGIATKHHINMTPAQFTNKGYNWNQIFIVNPEERDYYQTGDDLLGN